MKHTVHVFFNFIFHIEGEGTRNTTENIDDSQLRKNLLWWKSNKKYSQSMYIICTYLHKLHSISWKNTCEARWFDCSARHALASPSPLKLHHGVLSSFAPKKHIRPTHSPSTCLQPCTYTHTNTRRKTVHTPNEMTSRKQRCLRSFSSVFQPHEVWNSKQCRTLVKKTRFIMRRSPKK